MFAAALPSLDFSGQDLQTLELQCFRPLKVLLWRSASWCRPSRSGPMNFCLTSFILSPHVAQHTVVPHSGTVTTLKNFVADLSILLFGAPLFPAPDHTAHPYFKRGRCSSGRPLRCPNANSDQNRSTHFRLWM